MALDKKMTEELNDQINAEMHSALLYLSMGSWFEDKGLMGISHWFRCQYLEENMHAMKMYNFVFERGAKVELKTIEGPGTEWNSYLEVFRQVAEHEALITSRINKLVALARELNDYASESFLMWYVDEQVEEEATASDLVSRFKLIGDDPNALLMLDAELKSRGASPDVLPIHLGDSPA